MNSATTFTDNCRAGACPHPNHRCHCKRPARQGLAGGSVPIPILTNPTEIASGLSPLATTRGACHCEHLKGARQSAKPIHPDCFGTIVPRNDRVEMSLRAISLFVILSEAKNLQDCRACSEAQARNLVLREDTPRVIAST